MSFFNVLLKQKQKEEMLDKILLSKIVGKRLTINENRSWNPFGKRKCHSNGVGKRKRKWKF